MNYIPPDISKSGFNCPHCGAFAKQIWASINGHNKSENYIASYNNVLFAICGHCGKFSIWLIKEQSGTMIYPNFGAAPLPNSDMPEDVRIDYEEARSILNISPRGAVALLRLAVQKLCKHLGGEGENINSDIALLVSKGLPDKLQRALDSVREVGNNAVHPGQIDLKDDVETAIKLFSFINIICDNQITQHNTINKFYTEVLPESSRNTIDKRDKR